MPVKGFFVITGYNLIVLYYWYVTLCKIVYTHMYDDLKVLPKVEDKANKMIGLPHIGWWRYLEKVYLRLSGLFFEIRGTNGYSKSHVHPLDFPLRFPHPRFGYVLLSEYLCTVN